MPALVPAEVLTAVAEAHGVHVVPVVGRVQSNNRWLQENLSNEVAPALPGADDDWYYADFTEGDAWGNFAPWFKQAVEAFEAEDDVAWESIYAQLVAMGIEMRADDGESYTSFTLYVDGDTAWFVI